MTELRRALSVDAAGAADRTAMLAAMHEHGPLLLAVARSITLDEDESQDLVQTTFEIALSHLGELREAAALRRWLVRIETREALRVVRRLRRTIRGEPSLAIAESGPDLDRGADVRAALANLPIRMRAAVVMHYLVGLTVAEAAAALGVSENTIKSQLRVALARLRETLRDEPLRS